MSRYTPVPPDNFCGIPEEYSRYESSRAVIFPVPLERTTSHQQGARNGPAAILAASRHLELYDEELQLEPYKEIGIHTLAPIDTMDGGLGEVITELFTAETGLLDDSKFPVALGGEHALTPPLVSAVAQQAQESLRAAHRRARRAAPRISGLCRESRLHDAPRRRSLPGDSSRHPLDFRGRSARHPAAENARSIGPRTSRACRSKAGSRRFSAISAPTSIVTIDLGGFDPSVMPATGSPEPGGLDWYQVTSLLRAVADHKKIVGMDVVGLLPHPGGQASDLLAAKLVYKCLGYIFCQG